MKNELYKLAQDTEVLRQTLTQLQEYNREIKGMIDIDGKAEKESNEEYVLELKTYLGSEEVYPTGLPIGGGDINYAYYFSWQMIEKARDNIDIVRAELPQQEEELSALESSVKEYNALKAATLQSGLWLMMAVPIYPPILAGVRIPLQANRQSTKVWI